MIGFPQLSMTTVNDKISKSNIIWFTFPSRGQTDENHSFIVCNGIFFMVPVSDIHF